MDMITRCCLTLVLLGVSSTQGRENYYPDASTQVPIGTADGIGPLAPLGVRDTPVGIANVSGGPVPDLFVLTGKFSHASAFTVFRWPGVDRRAGIPVFGEPVKIRMPVEFPGRSKLRVFEHQGKVFALWIKEDEFRLAQFDAKKNRFVLVEKDVISTPIKMLWKQQGSGVMSQVEFVAHSPGIALGTRFGLVEFIDVDDEYELSNQRYVVGPDGIVLRGETTAAVAIAYPNENGVKSDLMLFGEGVRSYLQFTGRFDRRDQPIYEKPTPILQIDAVAWHSSLPVINVLDWDGDGDLDVVSGDSVGFVCWLENVGSTLQPKLLPPNRLKSAGQTIRIRPGYYRSKQGFNEANWGYTCPTVFDWNQDGLPDILLSSATSEHCLYLNEGTTEEPKLGSAQDLFCRGLDLHGAWRVKPGVGMLNGKMAYVLIDEDQEFHLYWKYDNQNLEDGGKLLLENGKPIACKAKDVREGVGGRVKITLFDWNNDGKNDLLLTSHGENTIPYQQGGLPNDRGSMVLLMLNVSDGDAIYFASPQPLHYKGRPLQMNEHSSTASPYLFEEGRLGMMVGIEDGRLYLLPPEDISWGAPYQQ